MKLSFISFNRLQETIFIDWYIVRIHHTAFHLWRENVIWFTSAVRSYRKAIKMVINAAIWEERCCIITKEREMIT